MNTLDTITLIDNHTSAAADVSRGEYFVVNRQSFNQNQGLLVGTVVKRIGQPEGRPSVCANYQGRDYWAVQVECPNLETRKLCCDVLTLATKEAFDRQKLMFSYFTRNLLAA